LSTDRFCIAITILKRARTRDSRIEISVAQTLVCAATGIIVEIILETPGAWSETESLCLSAGSSSRHISS